MQPVVSDNRWKLLPDWRELWRYRESLLFLTLRALQIRYRQAVLGLAWIVFQPLLMSLLFMLIFQRIKSAQPPGGVPYALFAYTGMVLWTFFSSAVIRATESIIGSQDMVRKIYFPRVFLPAAEVFACVVDLIISLVLLLIVIAIFWKLPPSLWIWFATLIILVSLCLVALALGMLVAAMNARFRDLRYVIPFLIQIGLFATPVLYDVKMLPAAFREILLVSPLAKLILQFRDGLLYGRYPEPLKLLAAAGGAVGLFLVCYILFRMFERKMADIV